MVASGLCPDTCHLLESADKTIYELEAPAFTGR